MHDAARYEAAQARRAEMTAQWRAWFADHGVDLLLEPTVPVTAQARGHGYDSGNLGGEGDPLIVFTATWNFTGFPVVALPAGLGARSGLPVGVSLIGPPDAEPLLVQAAIDLQEHELPPLRLDADADYAAASSSRAWRRAPTSSASAPSMRTSSATTSPEPSSRTVVRAGSALAVLLDREVAGGERGDLRQVRDAEDLAALGQGAQLRADRARRVPADAGIDLVEDERGLGAVVGDAHEREHDARELAAGGDLAQRAGRHAGVGGDEELDGVGAGGPGLALLQGDLEAARPPWPAPPGARARRAASRGAAFARVARSAPAAVACSARAASSSAVPRSSATSAPASSSRRDAAALGVGEDVGDRAAVLALQALEHGQALLGGLQRARLAVEPLGVAQQLAGQVVGLVGQRAPALGQRVEPGVDARHAVEPRRRRRPAAPSTPVPSSGATACAAPSAAARSASRWRRRSRAPTQLGLLLLRRVGGLDLLQLEREQVELALAGARRARAAAASVASSSRTRA